jgi:hypothetical protein
MNELSATHNFPSLQRSSFIIQNSSFVWQRYQRIDFERINPAFADALTFFHTSRMVFRMKTTLVIPDPVFRDLKRCAVERGETISELVTELLRKGLTARPNRKRLPPLPSFDMGRARVDVTDRDALYEVMEQG